MIYQISYEECLCSRFFFVVVVTWVTNIDSGWYNQCCSFTGTRSFNLVTIHLNCSWIEWASTLVADSQMVFNWREWLRSLLLCTYGRFSVMWCLFLKLSIFLCHHSLFGLRLPQLIPSEKLWQTKDLSGKIYPFPLMKCIRVVIPSVNPIK